MFFDIRKCKIVVGRKSDALAITNVSLNSKTGIAIPFTKYQIKESDFRTKTATFTSPFYIDLTTGQYIIGIISIYHENFYGFILSVDYDENTGLYNYQCQDYSRSYQSSTAGTYGTSTVYRILITLLTRVGLDINKKLTAEDRRYYRTTLSGLKNIDLYDQSLYKGNLVKGNPMKDKPKLIYKDKSYMEVIRDLTFGRMRFVDLWFNSKGVLNITPLSKTDWETTGLVLSANTDRNFKFDTTNAITSVGINVEGTDVGSMETSKNLINLDLTAFFGTLKAGINSATSTTNTTSNNNNKTTTSTTNTNGNPFNKKKKKIFVSADGGSCPFKSSIIKLLKKDGWTVTELKSCYGDAHSESYRRIDSSYAVNLTIFNGFCAGTVRECYDGWLKNHHEKKGVQLVYMWDTSKWNEGMKPYRNGDFSGYNAKNAHDWNRGGDYHINNVMDYMKKYKVCYTCAPTVAENYNQFKAGGYLKMKGLI